jgi:hypothetical protein
VQTTFRGAFLYYDTCMTPWLNPWEAPLKARASIHNGYFRGTAIKKGRSDPREIIQRGDSPKIHRVCRLAAPSTVYEKSSVAGVLRCGPLIR